MRRWDKQNELLLDGAQNLCLMAVMNGVKTVGREVRGLGLSGPVTFL